MTVGVANPTLDRIAERHAGTATEEALFRYSRARSRAPEPGDPRVQACCCGGMIVARSLGDDDIKDAVLTHNVRPHHLTWRERAGIV